MEAQLLLSFSTLTHLSLPVWDLIWWLQCLSLQLTHIHPVILISRRSHRAWPRPYQTAVLSICFSFLPSHFFSHTSPLSHQNPPPPPHFTPFSFLYSVNFYFPGHCCLTSHPKLYHYSTSITPTFPHLIYLLTPLSLSLLFSVWQWHWKVHPCQFKDGTAQELSLNAAWGTGLVHALQHGGFWCMVNTVEDARLGWFSWS